MEKGADPVFTREVGQNTHLNHLQKQPFYTTVLTQSDCRAGPSFIKPRAIMGSTGRS